MRFVALCGSLRQNSYNRALLNEAQNRIGSSSFEIFNDLNKVPPFNPDDERRHDSVLALREMVKASDRLIIASPEYVHGVPGILKNALDWVVGSGECDGKVTALWHVTPSANEPRYVREGLNEILTVMTGGKVLSAASLVVTGAFKKFDGDGKIIDGELSQLLDLVIEQLRKSRNL